MSLQEDLKLKIQGDAANARAALNELAGSIKALEGQSQVSSGRMSGYFSTALGTLTGFLGAQAIMATVRGAFDFAVAGAMGMNQTLETTTLRFGTLMGDSKLAEKHVRDLFEIAKKTPFETGPIIEASLKLQTFGGNALNTRDNILLLGDAAAATGAPIDQLGFWVGRLYSAVQGGQPFGEAAMRLQELAVLTPQARREMEALQQSGKSSEEVFAAFTGSLGGFTGAMEKQAGTWAGVTSTFSDTINILVADTLKPYFEVIRDLGAEVNNVLGSMADKADDVKAVVAQTKDTFLEFVEVGLKGTVTGFNFVIQEAIALHKIYLDLINVIKGVQITVLGMGYASAKVMDSLTLGQAGWKEHIDELGKGIEELAQDMLKRDNAIWAASAAQEEWNKWASETKTNVEGIIGKVRDHTETVVSNTRAQKASNDVEAETRAQRAKRLKEEKEEERARVEWLRDTNAQLSDQRRLTQEAGQAIGKGLTPYIDRLRMGVVDAVIQGRQFNIEMLQPMANRSQEAKVRVGELTGSVIKLGDTLRTALASMPNTIFQALTGGGGVRGGMQAVGSQFGGMLGEQIQEQLTNKLSNFGSKQIGKFASGLLGMLPGVGSLIGPGISWLTSKIMNIGGPSKQEREGREVKKQFQDQFGSFEDMMLAVGEAYEATGRGAQAARRDVENLMRAEKQGAEATRQARSVIEGAFSEARQDAIDLENAINEFGFSVGELGPKLQKQKLDEQAAEITNQWRLLVGAEIDVTTVNEKMAKKMQDYLNLAMKTGQDVPEAMRPIIEQMIRQGLLTDANGQKVTDTAQLNIKWGQDLNATMQKFVDKLDAVLRKIGAIPAAAQAAAQGIPSNPFQNWVVPDPDMPGGAGTEPIPSFANRTLERVTSSGLAMLHPGDVVGVPRGGTMGGSSLVINVAGSVVSERQLIDIVMDGVSRVQRDRYQQRAG